MLNWGPVHRFGDMEHLKQPPEMDFADMNLSERWRRWKQTMQLYLSLSMADKSEKEQCSAFLYIIGQDGREIYNTFTFLENETDKIKPLFKKFDDYCNPQKNVTVERHKFNTRYQHKTESIDQYVTDLRLIAQNCKFEALTDELIKDRIVCGTNSEKVKERLLRETDLTLVKALTICRAEEESKKQMKNLCDDAPLASGRGIGLVHGVKQKKPGHIHRSERVKNQNSTQNTQRGRDTHKYEKKPKAKKCKNCGAYHEPQKCFAQGKACHNCKGFDHFARCCPNKRVHTVGNENSDSDSEGDTFFIGAVNGQDHVTEVKSDECFVNLEIHNKNVKFKIDTGSQANILPLRVFEDMNTKGIECRNTKSTFTSYTGEKLKVKFKCKLKVKDTYLDFYVTETDQSPLLGFRASQQLGLVKIVMSVTGEEEQEHETDYVQSYSSVFSGLGCLDQPYHIDIDPSVTPVVNPTRKVPAALREKLKETLQDMEQKGVIRKVDHPTDWVNSLVIVEKPKTGKLRICLDPRHLNTAIRREHFELPTIEDITTRMHGAKYFAKIDARSGYWQIPLDEQSQLLTTFSTPFGRFCYQRMPFGIKSAQEVFQKRIATHFGDLPGVETDIDDILVWGESKSELKERLTKTLDRCKQINLTLNSDKCEFCVQQVSYVGHILTPEGVKPDGDKIRAIAEMPPPTDKKGVERLLGTVNYLAKFVPNMSTITQPIRNLLQKDVVFEWSAEQEKAFTDIKEILTAEPGPVLTYYDVTKPVTVSCDASQSGLGAVLMQEGKPIAYASRSMTSVETRYAQIEKELLSVLFSLERFHQYTYGKEVHVENDHKPLEQIVKKSLNSAPPRLQRMLLRLQRYDYKLTYKPGKQLVVADALSRAALPECESAENMETELSCYVHSIISNLPVSDSKLEEIRESAENELNTLQSVIQTGWPDNKWKLPSDVNEFWNHRDELSVIDGIVMKGEQIVIPPSLRKEMLQKIHMGHLGIEKCRQRARDVIFWPGMSAQIADLISSCDICLENRNSNQKEPMIPSQVPTLPWEMVATDLFHWEGSDYLIVVDAYSRYFEIAKLEDTKSSTVILHLKSVFARHGVPKEVKSDNGPQYSAREFQKFSQEWGFTHVTTSPYHSQANGLAEKSVQIVKRLLTKARADGKDPYLGLLEYRNTPVDNIGSPAQMLMGRRLRSVLPTTTKQLRPRTVKSSTVQAKLRLKQKRQRRYYDDGAKQLPPLNKGETIRVQQQGMWKPAVVESYAETPRSYNVQTPDGSIYRRNRRHLLQTNEAEMNRNSIEVPVCTSSPVRTSSPVKPVRTSSPTPVHSQGPTTTSSGRVSRPPVKFKDYVTP